MATLRENLLPVFDIAARRLVDDLGFRPNALTIIIRTWTGTPGAAGSTFADGTPLAIDPRPKVRELTGREIAASGGKYSEGDLRISKITPAYTTGSGGGYTVAQIAPEVTRGQTVIYRIVGPNEGDYKRVDAGTASNFGYELTIRRLRGTP